MSPTEVCPDVSIIIPALNERATLPRTLAAVRQFGGAVETIVVDGGSSDGTLDIAHEFGAIAITAPRGRGTQMHAGAAIARSERLWFLHADTIPAAASIEQIVRALDDATVVAGNFRLSFDGCGAGARRLTRIYPYLRFLGLCYGDSGNLRAPLHLSEGRRISPLPHL